MLLKLEKIVFFDSMNLQKEYITAGIIFHYFSVFHQFNGRFGPTALSVTSDSKNIITSLFEFNSLSNAGCIGILSC